MTHTFSQQDKRKALAIVRTFETGYPVGRYDACVVLNDGAGVSYGINQFTHRSGSLAAVVRAYLATEANVGSEELRDAMTFLTATSPAAIRRLSSDLAFKTALRSAAATPEMRAVQHRVAEELYLQPAVIVCRRRGFTTPLALAVIYDSITHGSFEMIAGRVTADVSQSDKDPLAAERAWITEYVRKRHQWLREIKRLRVTSYRTRFFLDQIAVSNWELRLPVIAHGVRLTGASLGISSGKVTAASASASLWPDPAKPAEPEVEKPAGQTAVTGPPDAAPSVLDTAGGIADAATRGFDRVEGALSAVTTRRDAAKSIWAAVAGTATQAVWAVFGFFIGLPRVVWVVVAVLSGVLAILYLYRQITLGRIREMAGQLTNQ